MLMFRCQSTEIAAEWLIAQESAESLCNCIHVQKAAYGWLKADWTRQATVDKQLRNQAHHTSLYSVFNY